MRVDLEWMVLRNGDPEWGATRCVYAYADPDDGELLYIGKADGPSIRARWRCSDKQALRSFLRDGGQRTKIRVFAGFPDLPRNARLTRELLCDIESLLIYHLRPRGNIQAIHSRIRRPGLTVRCWSDWPHRRTLFVDD